MVRVLRCSDDDGDSNPSVSLCPHLEEQCARSAHCAASHHQYAYSLDHCDGPKIDVEEIRKDQHLRSLGNFERLPHGRQVLAFVVERPFDFVGIDPLLTLAD